MPKGNSGIKRNGGGTGTTAPATEQTSTVRTFEPSETSIEIADPNSIQQLRELASRGEVPLSATTGNDQQYEKFFEEFDRLYPTPPGILNDYRIVPNSKRSAYIYFNHDMAYAESPGLVPLREKFSESAKNGMIKYEIYRRRAAVERTLYSRMGGYSSYDLADKYGSRVISAAEKAHADKEMIAYVEKMLASPMSKRGLAGNQSAWTKVAGGWRRNAAMTAADYGMTFESDAEFNARMGIS